MYWGGLWQKLILALYVVTLVPVPGLGEKPASTGITTVTCAALHGRS